MSQPLLVIILVLSISVVCLGRPQNSLSSGNEDAELLRTSTEKVPTELFFGPVGGFVGEVQVKTGSLTVNKKPRRQKPSPDNNGPRASALISDDSFGSFRSFDSVAPNVAVAAGTGMSISSGGAVLSFDKPAEVVPDARH